MFRSPLFAWSPRPDRNADPFDTPASQSSSRFGAFQNNIRSMINGSSIYSQSPALPQQHSTPKPPFLGFLRREHSPNPNAHADQHELPHHADGSRSPLRAHHTAGSYIQTIEPLQYPREPENTYGRHPADVPLPRHPADVPLPRQDSGFSDPEIQQLADDINHRRRKRKHRRRKHKRADHWVRRRSDSSSSRGPMLFVRGTAARGKMFACIISGGFLLTVLATYLAIALTNRDLGQEIHILFIMVLLSITIFFCHSLIRLCMLILNPSRNTQQPQVQAMLGPDGFQPIVPIRVHLARDEENAAQLENDLERASLDLEKDVPPPPPAYGLWRSSVRVDPNLLHWQRVEGQDSRNSTAPHSRQGSASGPPARSTNAAAPEGPRPPSYASEDGVSYIVEAAPRSTVRQSHSGVSDIHPAWRPGYAMSEIRGDEWGRRR